MEIALTILGWLALAAAGWTMKRKSDRDLAVLRALRQDIERRQKIRKH